MTPELWSAMTLAVSAGAIAAFNPCGFALLPTYLALFLGEGRTTRSAVGRAVAVGGSMTAGFVLVFGIAGLAVTGLSLALGPWLSLVTLGSGAVLVAVGVALLAGRDPSLRIPHARLRVDGTPRGMLAYGVVYATVSLSCTLPVFVAAVVSTFTATGGSAGAGVLALLGYALGMGAVMAVLALVAALFGAGTARRARALIPHLPRLSGAFVLLAGGYVLWYGWVEYRTFRGELGGTGPVAWVAAASAAVGNAIAGVGGVPLVAAALGVLSIVGVGAALRRRTRESPVAGPGSPPASAIDEGRRTVRAIWNGTVIAESDDTVVVEGNHYFPAESIRWDLLEASEHRSTCPWKGQARYWSVDDGARRGTDVAWSYPEPSPAAREIAGHVAFWRGVTVEGLTPVDLTAVPPARYIGTELVMEVLAGHGRDRIERLDAVRVLALGMLGGSFITTGALLAMLLGADAPGEGALRLVEGLGFSAGFFFVILSGAVLFTETNVVLPAVLLRDARPILRVIRFWVLAWVGNALGAVLIGRVMAFAIDLSPSTAQLLAETVAAKSVAVGGGPGAWWSVVVSGVLANWLVGMAAFFATMGRTIIGKYVPVFLAVTAFVAAGFQHSPANMGFFSLESAFAGDLDWGQMLAWNLAPAGLGNVVGGGIAVAVLLTWAYAGFTRPRDALDESGDKTPPESGERGGVTGALERVAELTASIRQWWATTRPVSTEARAALAVRWAQLPDSARTPAQVLGRHSVGCEGTHGVFPQCNLTCTPCYHSADANKVRVDAEHTLREVDAQMAYLRSVRGPRGHAQLIGGEVTLLDPDTHAEALATMRRYGREPMSFTHGDVDEDYLRRLVTGPDGGLRLRRVSFAAHFDSLMRGRRGLPRPRSEAEVTPFRREFAATFDRLRRDLGLRSYLAHNMTVTPANLDEVAGVVRDCLPLGFQMLSFQPAAYLGDSRRWREDLRQVTADAVWSQIEEGVGARLPWRAVQFGDPRCNRTASGWRIGGRWVPLLDDTDPRDLAVRDWFYRRLGGMQVGGTPAAVLAVRLARALATNASGLPLGLGWLRRAVRRSGGVRALVRHRVRPLTIVMHRFMDAAEVAPAWELLERGVTSDDPAVRATQERLQACSYSMAHPGTGRLVPACAQHGVLDPGENAELRDLLPLVEVRSGRATTALR